MKDIATQERMNVRKLRELGIDEKSEQYIRARKLLIETEKKYQNVPGGYWVSGLQPDAAENAMNGRINICNKDRIMVMVVSDGLERWNTLRFTTNFTTKQ